MAWKVCRASSGYTEPCYVCRARIIPLLKIYASS